MEDEGRIIATGAIGPYWGKEDESSLFTIFVLPEYQGKGVGRLIMDTLEKDEYALRAKRIEIPADKATADKLYAACKTIEGITVFRGRIASGDAFIASHERRQRIAEHFGALACEMEGAAVGTVCYRNGVPFAILRSISDDFNNNELMDYYKFREIAAGHSIRVIGEFIKSW